MAYNDRVVAFLRQDKIFLVLKEKHASIGSQKSLKEKIMIIRQEGTAVLNRMSHDVELTLLLRYNSENMNNNEFLPGRYTDLTFEAESGSIHSAPNRKSQDFFRGFHL